MPMAVGVNQKKRRAPMGFSNSPLISYLQAVCTLQSKAICCLLMVSMDNKKGFEVLKY